MGKLTLTPQNKEETPKTSEAIFGALLAEAGNERRRETLLRLKEACDALAAKGRPPKLADIQRSVEDNHGKKAGPKAQSIANEKNRALGMRHYIDARERETAKKSPAKPVGRHGSAEAAVNSLIDKIEDMDIRSSMIDIHDRAILAERGLARAKELFKNLNPGANIEQLLIGSSKNKESTPSQELSQDGIKALDRLLAILTDDKKLNAVGLTYDSKRVRRKTGTRDELIDQKTLEEVALLLKKIDN